MKKILPVLFAFLVVSFFCVKDHQVNASLSNNVFARVSGIHLSVSGYISPYASIVMTSNNIFFAATVADKNGDFSFPDIEINKNFPGFCLEAIDFKRIGTSYTCFNVDSTQGSIIKKDIFLPPTLGLSRTEIAENGEVTAFGYTMPLATVTVHVGGKILTTVADNTGYYEIKIKGIKAGRYEVYSMAVYNGVPSLTPSRKTELRALSWWEQIIAFFQELWRKLLKLLTSVYLNPLWLMLPILILIIILTIKIWPDRFSFIWSNKLLSFLPKRKKKLHHSWFIGY
jgi:hypothetical protein